VPNPDPTLFSSQTWFFLTVLSQKITELASLLTGIKENLLPMREYFESEDLFKTPIPVKSLQTASNFKKLLLVKAVCPEKIMLHIGYFVQIELGSYY
jgi:DNA gyrase/topoisomerase IV subunit B